jgi:orotate phosphoribosyltransferase
VKARARLLELLKLHSYQRKRVVLASGKESDFFIDCKQTVLTAEGHSLVGELMFEALLPYAHFAGVAGVELGGCPLASAVAMVSFLRGNALDAIYVRKEPKDHGSQRMLEGDSRLVPGAHVAILEDVITTGGSTLKAARKIEDAGYVVGAVIALVDRQEGGAKAIEDAGYPLTTLYLRSDFEPGFSRPS